MGELEDPRVTKARNVALVVGTGAVAAAGSLVVIAAGASVVVASVVAVCALAAVNFLLPVAMRSVALWRQKTLTALAETFSEETILEDERREGERIREQEAHYIEARSEIEGAIEDLTRNLEAARDEEAKLLQEKINALRAMVADAEERLRSKKADFIELQRVNKVYISMHRAGNAALKFHGTRRDAEEIQRIELARSAIKTRMRAALASSTIESMNKALDQPRKKL